MPIWRLGGRAKLKRRMADSLQLNVQFWPLNTEVLAFVQEAKSRGRKVVLATAADSQIAAAMQSRLKLFDELVTSDGSTNLSGKIKAATLSQRFGAKNFDYIGNSRSDLPVWAEARLAYVVDTSNGMVQKAEKVARVERVFIVPPSGWQDWVRGLRLHQWSKNLLLIIPMLGAHKWTDPARMWLVMLGMAAFSLCASSVYLLNDLLDLESDRQHHSKQHRPLASGKISLLTGLITAPLLLLAAAALASNLGLRFAAILGAYYLMTVIYSLRLKQAELLDVLTLAGLYGIRVLAGGVVAEVMVSDWLMMFSLFVFLSLAFAKRFTELRMTGRLGETKLKGRAYAGDDTELVSSMGVSSGYLSVLVLAMYVSHPSVTALYLRPQLLWLACPVLLYWISRVWLLAHRGRMHNDPIVFALRDWQSWLVVALMAIIGFMAGPK